MTDADSASGSSVITPPRTLCAFCRKINVNTIVPYFPPGDDDDNLQVCLVHQPSYNALKRSAVGGSATSPDYCPLCLFFFTALERKNGASRRPPAPEAFKDHKKSQIWLVSGDQAVFDLSQPKGLFSLRVNVGNSTLIKAADFNITSLPGKGIQTTFSTLIL